MEIGPYIVEGELGRGAMGVVYRARPRGGGAPVAVKTVDPGQAGRFDVLRRELAAASRLRHPGVASVVDHGVDDGVPWYAMELVEGVPLVALAPQSTHDSVEAALTFYAVPFDLEDTTIGDDLEDGPLATDEQALVAGGQLPRILTLLRRLCSTLSWLHGEGVVHRDLKPGNVLVDRDGVPVVVDFGIAASFSTGRERLVIADARAGTVDYMSPEQIRGDTVDARADLYALGCLTYELLVGFPPFRSASLAATLQRHLTEPPTPPSELVAGVPEALDELVLALLAKRPEDRIGYADVVGAQLAELGAKPPPWDVRARPYLYRPRLAGRHDVVRDVVHRLSKPGVVFVGGRSGVGKTRLALEVARSLEETSVEVAECLAVASDGSDAAGPLHPFASTLDRVRDAARDSADRLFADDGAPLASWLDGNEVEDDALLLALTAVLGRLEGSRPTLLLLDDLQWADAMTLDWVRSAVRHPGALRMLVTFREEDREQLGALVDDAVVLEPLEAEAIRSMVGDMLALPRPGDPFVDFLLRTTGGNPFHLAETLRTAIAEELLFRDAEGTWHILSEEEGPAAEEDFAAMSLPANLQTLVGRRLDALWLQERELAEVIAVIGREAPLALVEQVAGDVRSALTGLVQSNVVTVTDDEVRFEHDKLREVAYDRLAPMRRIDLHAAVAEALGDGDPAVLAVHWERAEAVERAASCAEEAGHRARAKGAHDDAITWFGKASALGAETIALRVGLGRSLALRGRPAEALDVLEPARSSGDPEVLLAACRANTAAGRLDEAHRDALAALDALRATDASVGEALVLVGNAAMNLGLECGPYFDEARRTGVPAVVAGALVGLGSMHRRRGGVAYAAATDCFHRAAQIAREAGLHLLEGDALNNLANEVVSRGENALAESYYHESREAYQRAGSVRGEAKVRANLAILYHSQGRYELSDRTYALALQTFRDIGERRYEGHALACMARHARSAGDLELARERAAASQAILEEVGDVVWLTVPVSELARVDLWTGQAARAERRLRDLPALEAPDLTDVPTQLLLADTLLAQRRPDDVLVLLDGHRSPEAAVRRAEALLQRGDPADPGAVVPKAADEAARYWRLRWKLGDVDALSEARRVLRDWVHPTPPSLADLEPVAD